MRGVVGRLWPVALVLMLAACAGRETRPPAPDAAPRTDTPTQRWNSAGEPAGEQGEGLWAPHIRDGAPDAVPDPDAVPEPVPRAEPRARYGNRSPYVVLGRRYHIMDSVEGYTERGIASWYGTKFHGRATSSFEPYDIYQYTAAHKTLPLPSYVRVTNLENGRSVVVRVNDRGPFHDNRLIDLSYIAAVKLGVHLKGTARVEVEALTGPLATVSQAPAGTRPSYHRGPAPRSPHAAEVAAAASAPAPEAAPLAATGPVYVQAGSYRERDNARRASAQLDRAGIGPLLLQEVEVDGHPVWRLRIGPLQPAQADGVRQRVHGLGFHGARILSR